MANDYRKTAIDYQRKYTIVNDIKLSREKFDYINSENIQKVYYPTNFLLDLEHMDNHSKN